jgi:outer membrane lipoprotein carrier protein
MFLLVSEATAASAQEQLQGFVSKVQAATGNFSQYTVGTQGQTKPVQSGRFAFQRPGRFKWDVLKPYAQQIVSDGQQLFQFDPDLNQVTVRKVDQAIGSSPAAILFGAESLEQSFAVTALPDKEGLSWLRAKPRNGEAGFVHVDLGFSSGLPARIILLDAFGQSTHIELSGIVPNPTLAAETFRFVPPPGADVVRMQ